MSGVSTRGPLQIEPLTPERWLDLEELFGPRGAYAGCWCMWWRLPGPEFHAGQRGGNREAFRALVAAGEEPGLLAYRDGAPVGWCAIAPREQFLRRLLRSHYWKPVAGEGIWSLNCFFIKAGHRRQGVATALLHAAVEHARSRGAQAVEAYPRDVGPEPISSSSLYFGTTGMFLAAGFVEVARRHPELPIVRRYLSERTEEIDASRSGA